MCAHIKCIISGWLKQEGKMWRKKAKTETRANFRSTFTNRLAVQAKQLAREYHAIFRSAKDERSRLVPQPAHMPLPLLFSLYKIVADKVNLIQMHSFGYIL